MFVALTIFLHITLKKLISMVYTCELCDFHTTGSIGDLLAHIRGFHNVNVNPGNIHYAHCNECERQNGHGRRLNSFKALQMHLEADHGIDILEE